MGAAFKLAGWVLAVVTGILVVSSIALAQAPNPDGIARPAYPGSALPTRVSGVHGVILAEQPRSASASFIPTAGRVGDSFTYEIIRVDASGRVELSDRSVERIATAIARR